ncbi:lysyl-tRNA synthetase, class 2 [Alteromonadaceae bacterium Bs31]|nr:lysyl-tRNA synthetase, class 2 [Alteromonadaceae bacterium Bs31]
MSWQPTASIETLRARAEVLSGIRRFFADLGVLEVEVPSLGHSTVTDAYIESLCVDMGGQHHFLQTSPEYFMKRLLAAGSGAIYFLGKAFRKDEAGRLHNPEFTMLEWYRPGFDDRQLANELVALIQRFDATINAQFSTYASIFEKACGINPHSATTEQLQLLAEEKIGVCWRDEAKSTWLDLLFTHLVEPGLDGLQVIFDYPECQSALAKLLVNERGERIARRFELYWNGTELANGYWELTDAKEQSRRFDADCLTRERLGCSEIEPDRDLLQALEAGLPACAGVALGVDRLLMCLLARDQISEVMAFR